MSLLKIHAARERLWKAQERFNYFPDILITINDTYMFNFNAKKIFILNGYTQDLRPPYLKCYLKEHHLEGLLNKVYHWNNLEIGCHIEFDRKPNVYLPDVHTLLSFFHM